MANGFSRGVNTAVLHQNLVTIDIVDFLQPSATLCWYEGITILAVLLFQSLTQLRDLKADPPETMAGGFRGYVAVAAYNACYEYLRREYPNRSRLKARLRYALRRGREFALWMGEGRQWLYEAIEIVWSNLVGAQGAMEMQIRRTFGEPQA